MKSSEKLWGTGRASSYLGVVLEQLGLTTWNGKSKGIEWRLNGKVPTGAALAVLLRDPQGHAAPP